MAQPRSKQVMLVADDLSAGAELCLRRAALLPGGTGRALDIVNVVPEGHALHRGRGAIDTLRATLQRRAAQLAGAGRRRGRFSTVSTTVVEGEPHVEIIRHGRLVEADLIVMGAHARRTWRDALAGTTTERVIRKGDVPVLVVKRPPRGPYRTAVAAIERRPPS